MSRLDSHIRQKIAQRDSIDLAARWVAAEPGVVVEFGLGTGRSYSHLSERCPRREIFCFDRRDVCHPSAHPPASRFVLGELDQVLTDPALHARFVGQVILLHLDLGAGGPADEVLPEFVVGATHRWLRPRAVVLSDQALTLEPAWALEAADTTGQVAYPERYFVYRRAR